MITASRTQSTFIAALAGLCLGAFGASVLAQAYPNKPITLISTVPPGGAIDVVTRSWTACAQEIAGQPIVLVNRPGANGVVAANALKQAAADGYTVMLGGMSQTTITPFIFKKQPFDPEKDFHGAALFGETTLLLVASAQSGIKSLKDLQAYASSRPKGLDMGHSGIGHPSHLLGAATVAKLGVQSTLVPFAGEAGAISGMLAGEIQAMVMLAGSATQFVDNGKMVPLMTFSQRRLPGLPNVPTVAEELKDPALARTGWLGITTKAGTPKVVIDAVESWTKACMDNAAFRQALERALFTPQFVSQNEYANVVRRDIEFWKPWIARLNISNE